MSRRSRVPPPGTPRLLSDSHPKSPPSGVHVANIDGASRGNPGPASYAVVLRDPNGKVILELAKKLGRATNNVAEYYALLAALDYAASNAIGALRVRSDSELLVRQVQGRYKVKSADLKPLHERAAKLAHQLEYFVIEHVRREMNRDADGLANLALDQAAAPARESARSSDSLPATARPSSLPPRISARFVKGVFVPAEPPDLPEGSEVILDLRIAKKH